MIGSAETMKATVAGSVRNRASSIPRFCVSHRLYILAVVEKAGDGWKQDRAESDADQAKRKLVQPVRIIDVGDGAGIEQSSGERGRDQQIDLHGAGAGRCGDDQLHHAANVSVDTWHAKAKPHTGAMRGEGQPG